MGANNFKDFLAKLRAEPGVYSAAVPGLGTLGHLMVASFNETLKTQMQIVPYRGAGPALNDALAGMVQVMPDQLPSVLPHVKAGKLLPVVLAGHERSPDMPEVPTFKELGYPELNELGISWFGMVAPAGTPPAMVAKLQEAALKAARLPEVVKRLKDMGAVPTQMEQSRFADQIAAERKRNKELLDRAGVKPE
jgi:tripartite-type tricarboxylate transporter receptor subunit TctC